MTTATTSLTWVNHPLGRAARIVLALTGLTVSTLILTTSAMVQNGTWFFVLAGVAVAALSVRAALHPSIPRLSLLGIGLLALPLLGSTF